MKKRFFFYHLVVLAAVSALFITSLSAKAQETERAFRIERFVIAGSVENLEPVGMVDMFSAVTERVYSFLEAKDISRDSTVFFVWYYGEELKATVELPLRKGTRWRTYSSKKLGGLKGEWKVELQDADRNVLDSVAFMVE